MDVSGAKTTGPESATGFLSMAGVALALGLVFALSEGLLAVPLAPKAVPWVDKFRHVLVPQLRSAAVIGTLFMIAAWLFVGGISRVIGWKSWPAALFGLMSFLLWLDLLDYTKRVRLSGAAILALGLAVQGARWFARRPDLFVLGSRRLGFALAPIVLLGTVGVSAVERVRERVVLGRLPAAPVGAPSVLLIVADTLRADYLSTYGYQEKTTPFLDSLAKGGVLFERAYAASSWTLPSHISMMSGRFPFEHQVRSEMGEIQALDPRYPLLAEIFQRHGYATGGFTANPWYCHPKQGFERGFVRYRSTSYTLQAMLRRTAIGARIVQHIFPRLGWFRAPDVRGAGDINGEVLEWLDGTGPRPFFAFLNYMEPHGPLLPPMEFAARFSPEPEKLLARDPLNFLERMQDTTTPEMRQMEVDAYAASVAYLDSMLAELHVSLKQRGRHQNLLVVVTSDHGDSFGEQGLYGHRIALYQSQIHVPLIFHYPGSVPENQRISAPVSHRTLARTLVDLARIPGENPFPGSSMSGAWEQPGRWMGGPVLAEVDGAKFGTGPAHWPVRKGWLKSWITGQWQYILREDGVEELFDLINDPEQATNAAALPETRQVADRLRHELEQLVPAARAAPRVAPGGGSH